MSKSSISISDFSSRSIAKVVKGRIWTQGSSAYPIAIGGGLCVAFALFGYGWLLAVLGVAVGLGVLMWLINFVGRKNSLSVRYLSELREKMRKERETRLASIAKELEALNCAAGSVQMGNLKSKYESFVTVIDEKFNPMEVTYGRYLGIAEQVYLAGIDNLQRAVIALKSVNSIDKAYIEKQIRHLDENGIENDASDYKTLNDRLLLLQDTEAHVDRLLVQNEKAMTQLVETGAKLAHVETSPTEAKMEMDDAMGELSYIAEHMDAHDRREK